MKSSNLLLLVVSLAFVSLASSGTLKPDGNGTEKAGSCPYDPYRCFREDPRQCLSDQDCLNEKKCCFYFCGFKCVQPQQTDDTD
ncbi:WAP four-disulfide core domain protein 12-like isoform X2 [Notamacropus eugenii]|uniref:WAP four-disulfide core domain protein 12-like isoform X1 n=1 Tax=Notamacropus eugenii TaxID=9315 RepID=UPI003B67DD21